MRLGWCGRPRLWWAHLHIRDPAWLRANEGPAAPVCPPLGGPPTDRDGPVRAGSVPFGDVCRASRDVRHISRAAPRVRVTNVAVCGTFVTSGRAGGALAL